MSAAWTLDLEHADHRAAISPIRGTAGPYRLQIIHPNGEQSVGVGMATMERVIEFICTLASLHGDHVPVQVRAEWVSLAHKYDEPEGRYVQ